MIKILIVNDIPSVNRLLAYQLESEGFQVDTVLTGNDGLRQLRQDKYDIILLDYKLPDINGDQVCRQIKDDPRLESTPVYFISALEKDQLDKVISETGAQGYLDVTSPVEELARCIREVLK